MRLLIWCCWPRGQRECDPCVIHCTRGVGRNAKSKYRASYERAQDLTVVGGADGRTQVVSDGWGKVRRQL